MLFPPAPPVKVECVWLPVYLVTISVEHRGTPGRVVCSVDGLSGAFAIFEMTALITAGEPGGESFASKIDAAEAERIGRERLIVDILRRRGRRGKPVPGATESVELLRWPYWVYYHRRRGGRMDIQLLDAATGERAGHKIKLGLLDAFRAKPREQLGETKGA
jgi:hypothetical protein